MNSCSKNTLNLIEKNSPEATDLRLADIPPELSMVGGGFNSSSSDDYSRLGDAIERNTHLTTLHIPDGTSEDKHFNNKGLLDGLTRNTSINSLRMTDITTVNRCSRLELLEKVYKENSNLTSLYLRRVGMGIGGHKAIANILTSCVNLKNITICQCFINNEKLIPIVKAIKGSRSLEILELNKNHIMVAGCEVLAVLLADPKCNLSTLNLSNNLIGNEGGTILANSLVNNSKLKKLNLDGNMIMVSGLDSFTKVLCNTESINSTYYSNHTLEEVMLPWQNGEKLDELLLLNSYGHGQAAIIKILQNHRNIDMTPLFDLDSEGTWTLKALPYLVDWFVRSIEAVGDGIGRRMYDIDQRKLSAMYEFAKAMPLLFVPASHTKGESKDRIKIPS